MPFLSTTVDCPSVKKIIYLVKTVTFFSLALTTINQAVPFDQIISIQKNSKKNNLFKKT